MLFEQFSVALGCDLIVSWSKTYLSHFGLKCVEWFVQQTLSLGKKCSE